VEQFIHLGTTLTNQNFILEEEEEEEEEEKKTKSKLKSGYTCYHSVHNLLSSSFLFKNIKIKIYKTIILPIVLFGCKNWYLKLRKDHRLRVFEKRVLRRIFGPKREEVNRGSREDYITRSFMIPSHQIFFG